MFVPFCSTFGITRNDNEEVDELAELRAIRLFKYIYIF